MYRPQSQAIRQHSTQTRDMKSKSKKLSSKQRKQYIKKLIQNNPNHIQNQKKLKLDMLYTNRFDIKQKIESFNRKDDQDKQWYRSGLIRFLKPILNQNQYRKFKRLFQIFNKIERLKQQIQTSNCATNKFIKEPPTLFSNQKLKELKQNLLKCQLQEEKVLLEIENQTKEQNTLNRLFSNQKDNKQLFIQKKFGDLHIPNLPKNRSSKIQDNINKNQQKRIQKIGSNHQRATSQINLSGQNIKTEQFVSIESVYLMDLIEVIKNIDKKSDTKTQTVFQSNQAKSMFNEIRSFITTKQKTIDQLFVSLTNLNSINHKQKQDIDKIHINQTQKCNSFNKFHQININDTKSKQQKLKTQSQITQLSKISCLKSKRYTSFKSLFIQIQSDLLSLSNLSSLKQRNNELAKKLLSLSTSYQKQQDQILLLKQQNKSENSNNFILKKENQLMQNKIHHLSDDLKNMQTNQNYQKNIIKQKQIQLQKYTGLNRDLLMKQSQMRILVSRNQQLNTQMNQIKQTINQITSQRAQQIKQLQELRQFKLSQQDKCQKIYLSKQITPNNNTITNLNQAVTNLNQIVGSTSSSSNINSIPLIYKQQQKKNKKLSEQNKNLKQKLQDKKKQICELVSQIQLIKQNSLINEQGLVQKHIKQVQQIRQSHIFQYNKLSSNHNQTIQSLISQKKHLQQQFQQIVTEKLKIQTTLSKRTKQYQSEKLKSKNYKLRFQQMQQAIQQIQQQTIYIKNQLEIIANDFKHEQKQYQLRCQQLSRFSNQLSNRFQQVNIKYSQLKKENEKIIQDNLLLQNRYNIVQEQNRIKQQQIQQLSKKQIQQLSKRTQIQQLYKIQLQQLSKRQIQQLQKINNLKKQLEQTPINQITSNVISFKYQPIIQNQEQDEGYYYEVKTSRQRQIITQSKQINQKVQSTSQTQIIQQKIGNKFKLISRLFQYSSQSQKYPKQIQQNTKNQLKINCAIVDIQIKAQNQIEQTISFEQWMRQQLQTKDYQNQQTSQHKLQLKQFFNFCQINLKPNCSNSQQIKTILSPGQKQYKLSLKNDNLAQSSTNLINKFSKQQNKKFQDNGHTLKAKQNKNSNMPRQFKQKSNNNKLFQPFQDEDVFDLQIV